MKKLMFAIGLGLISGSVYASCFGPYCYTDQGAQITAATTIQGLTLAQMNASSPPYAGQLIYVSDGLQAKLCISSGTAAGAYTVVSATSTVVLGGLLGHCN